MPSNKIDFPRLFIAGLRGGSGKTSLSIGIIAAWRRRGNSVAPFKKGPDYIDAGWLALAAGRPCFNLDSFLISPANVLSSFLRHTGPGDIAIIEGNRGLYDSIDVNGDASSAEVAKLLHTPVILCVDCTKTTRTMAAIISGCQRFDADLHIAGIILNRVAGGRHESILRQNIEHYCGTPVLGAVPKLREDHLPERHMGLVPTPEHDLAVTAVDAAADMASRYLDLDALEEVARQVEPGPGLGNQDASIGTEPSEISAEAASGGRPVIGVIRDSAFQFYYPDNFTALTQAGADLVFLSALDGAVPAIDALYIGGGFPETHAERLAANAKFRERIKLLADEGLPIYAECGGLMYLGEALDIGGHRYPMTGVLPAVFGLADRPQGLGYTMLTVDRPNPYFPEGTQIRGHEFRYSEVLEWRGSEDRLVFAMNRGTGFLHRRDGIVHRNVLATYTHIHALGVPHWAPALVANARVYRRSRG